MEFILFLVLIAFCCYLLFVIRQKEKVIDDMKNDLFYAVNRCIKSEKLLPDDIRPKDSIWEEIYKEDPNKVFEENKWL